jgi:phosphoglucosamine mutase
MLKDGQRLFGTDGVRGVANLELTPDLAMAMARAAGEGVPGGMAIVGRDTRRSGEMLSSALQAGFNAVGVDTIDAGVIPVGGVSVLISEMGADLGVMVSASHNPAPDNGIKFFDRRGMKLTDDAEDVVEARLRRGAPWKVPYAEKVGARYEVENARARYLKVLKDSAEYSFGGMRIAIDAANGAAFQAAPELFEALKADVVVFNREPTGMNINQGCGATHPEALAAVAEGRVGLSFDGDADRLIAVDEDGTVANGDVVMAIIAKHLKSRDKLKNNKVVTTVMANLGFRQAMERAGIETIATQVGDRYVLEAMLAHKANIGGEQSGHVIQLDRGATGDGLATAVRLLEVMAGTGRELRDLRTDAMTEFPQILHNVSVAGKDRLAEANGLWDAVRQVEDELGEDGRVLVRASGTEALVRVMVEAASSDIAEKHALRLAEVVEQELG